MPILQLEHPVKDFDMWKAAFDRDPIDRRGLGVRRHRIVRPADDANYTVVELEFDTDDEAKVCETALRQLWSGGTGAPALAGTPQMRIVRVVEEQSY